MLLMQAAKSEERLFLKKYLPLAYRVFIIAGMVWGFIALIVGFIQAPYSSNMAVVEAYLASAFFTLLLYLTRRWWLDVLAGKGILAAILAGIFCALVVETVSWGTQMMAGASANVTSTNYLLNLLISMPWYIGLVIIYVRVQERRRFSVPLLLLLGGFYKSLLIGIINASTASILMGDQVSLVNSWWWMIRIGFWQYIPIYSSIMLIPAWILETHPAEPSPKNFKPAWLDAIRPAFWLFPYIVFWLAYSILPALLSTPVTGG